MRSSSETDERVRGMVSGTSSVLLGMAWSSFVSRTLFSSGTELRRLRSDGDEDGDSRRDERDGVDLAESEHRKRFTDFFWENLGVFRQKSKFRHSKNRPNPKPYESPGKHFVVKVKGDDMK